MNIIKKIPITLLTLILFVLPIFSFADTTTIPPTSTGGSSGDTNININIPNPTNAGDSLMSVLRAILNNVVMPIAAVGVVFWIIYAGFKFVVAQGNPTKIEEAKQTLLWSLIGAGILLGAAGISLVVQSTIEGLLK